MKATLAFLAAALLIAVALISCSDDNGAGPAQPKVPTVATAAIQDITHTTAVCGGTITSDGGAAVTARGVCWDIGAVPTLADNMTTDSSGNGSFISSLTGLSAGTTYQVRAYATNGAGTGYGAVDSFTTTAPNYLTISSTFEAGSDEGWAVSGGSMFYVAEGGNPGGFIEFYDWEDGCGYFTAPFKFCGDLSAFSGGTLTFDLKNTVDNGGTMLGCFGTIRISSNALFAEANVVPYDMFLTDWTSFSMDMTAAAWGVTAQQWDSIMGNVTAIIFTMDTQMGYDDRSGLDNFRLTSPALKGGGDAVVTGRE